MVLTLETGNADLPTQLAAYGLLIGPAGTEGTAWNQPGNGTGPYILDMQRSASSSLPRFESTRARPPRELIASTYSSPRFSR